MNKYKVTTKKTKSLYEIIDELARKEGYPAVKLSHTTYTAILKKAHKIKYLHNKNI
jgi:DNA-binding PadR family transcriptional regulator